MAALASTYVVANTPRGKVLAPFDTFSEDALSKLPEGKIVLANVSTPRNVKQHRLFFAVLKIVVENNETWGDVSSLKDAILVALKYVDAGTTLKGQMFFVPKSISFGSMTQEDFDTFFQKAMALITGEIIPGMDEQSLMEEVEDMLADKRFVGWEEYKTPTHEMAPTLRNLPDRIDLTIADATTIDGVNSCWSQFKSEYSSIPEQCKAVVRVIIGLHRKRTEDGDVELCATEVARRIEEYRQAFDGGQGAYQREAS